MYIYIAAVGSSPLIADEIKSAIKLIVGEKLHIQRYTTDEVKKGAQADLYICAQTQVERMRHFVAEENIFVIDLAPTSKFFIEVSRLPVGETVYIFNNRLAYTSILSAYCESLGIKHLHFEPIAYEEMTEMEIKSRLKTARYIIGVDRFVGEEVLLSSQYRAMLNQDVRIIPGMRTASVRSACTLLYGVAKRYHLKINQEYRILQEELKRFSEKKQDKELQEKADELVKNAQAAIEVIQAAAVQAIVNQIAVNEAVANTNEKDYFSSCSSGDEVQHTLGTVKELNDTLFIIMKKLEKII